MTATRKKYYTLNSPRQNKSRGGEIDNLMKKLISYVLAFLLIVVLLSGCSRTYDPVDDGHAALTNSCVNCHSDEAMLIATATPDTSSSGGEAGEG
jgi:hypothetical protein